jgi:hypothetical protein
LRLSARVTIVSAKCSAPVSRRCCLLKVACSTQTGSVTDQGQRGCGICNGRP